MESVKHYLALMFTLVTCYNMVRGQLVINEIRLSDNNGNGSYGRVEVRVNNNPNWGTICDDQWDDLDAAVVCRSLGFGDGGTVLSNLLFGDGTGPIWLNNVGCEGDENSLADCPQSPQIGNHNCQHSEDAGVRCILGNAQPATPTPTLRPVGPQGDNCTSQNQQVRLIAPAGQLGMGLVEIFYNNSWGSICDDLWDENDARVVCAMLCFNTQYARPGMLEEIKKATTPQSPIIVDNVRCTGQETRVQDCPHNPWYNHDCNLQEVASVTCIDLDSRAPDPPVPLLECSQGFLTALFSRQRDNFLEEKHLTVLNPSTSCSPLKSTTTDHVKISIPFNSCGTIVSKNTTHIIYSNIIGYDHTALDGNKVRVNTYRVAVSCEMPRNLEADRNLEPLTLGVTKKAEGVFLINMTFYRNNSFTEQVSTYPVRMPLGEWLNVALQLESIDSRLKLIVPDCVATPTDNRTDRIRYPLFEENCPNEPTLGFFPLSQIKFGFRYQPFKFLNNAQVFLHCGAFVCLVDEVTAECDRSCNTTKPSATGRRKRDLSTSGTSRPKYYIDSGPMYVYNTPGVETSIERIGSSTISTTMTIPLSEEIQEHLQRSSTTKPPTQTSPKPTRYGAGVTITTVSDKGQEEILKTSHRVDVAEHVSTTATSRHEEISEQITTPFTNRRSRKSTISTTSSITDDPDQIWLVFPKREKTVQNNKLIGKVSTKTNKLKLSAGVNGSVSVYHKHSLNVVFIFLNILLFLVRF